MTRGARHAQQRSQACADCVNLSAVPGINVFFVVAKDVDGRNKPGNDARKGKGSTACISWK
jgi:hypothetical protein